MKLFIDFETRSAVDLRKSGMYRYAEDPTTDVLCLAVKTQHLYGPPQLWVPEKFAKLVEGVDTVTQDQLLEIVKKATEIHAHNAGFERCMWTNIMVKRYGFPEIPLRLWRCTAAKAAAMNIPRSLDQACKVLGLPTKDKVGYNIMLTMCKPHAPLKKDKEWLAENGYQPHPEYKQGFVKGDDLWFRWKEKPEDFQANCKYCLNDVEIEYALDQALPELSESELAVWRMDQTINDRGVHVDLPATKAIVAGLAEYQGKLSADLVKLTHGQVTKASEVAKLQTWLKTRGLDLPDAQLSTVEAALQEEIADPTVRRVLEIRKSISKATSCSKYDAILRAVCADSRIRGMLLYYGAQATGRWSSRLVQLQNLPRGTMGMEEIATAIWTFENIGYDMLWGCPLEIGSSCVRSVLTAAPGKELLCADFSNIEGRGQAWLAGETWKLQAFQAYDAGVGPDLYKLAYSRSFSVPVEEVTKDQRQIGKVQELALGYGGGINAYATMAGNYGIDLEVLPDMILATSPQEEREAAEWTAQHYIERLKRYGQEPIMSFYAAVACDILKRRWRQAHPRIVGFWDAVEDAAIKTVNTGQPHQVGRLMFGLRDRWLHMRLPSGRLLAMFDAEVIQGDFKPEQLTFWGVDSETKKWQRKRTYGGDLFQSAIQAMARDVMAEAMLRLEEAGYPCVLTVHDEAVAEVDIGGGLAHLGNFNNIMATNPSWADGMPISVEGWAGERYRK